MKKLLVPIMLTAVLLAGCGNKKIKLIETSPFVDIDIDYPVGQITKDVTVTQKFISNCDSIVDIQVYGATYKRDNTATINVELLAGEDLNRIALWTFESADMEDNTIITLNVEEANEYEASLNTGLTGMSMLIRISSPNGEPDMSPTFWMTEEDIYPDGCLNVAGYDQYNDLWFQVEGVNLVSK